MSSLIVQNIKKNVLRDMFNSWFKILCWKILILLQKAVLSISVQCNSFLCKLQGLQPYSQYTARGNYLLNSLKGGSYSKMDVFIDFAPLSFNDRADLIVITNRYGSVYCYYLQVCQWYRCGLCLLLIYYHQVWYRVTNRYNIVWPQVMV